MTLGYKIGKPIRNTGGLDLEKKKSRDSPSQSQRFPFESLDGADTGTFEIQKDRLQFTRHVTFSLFTGHVDSQAPRVS